MRIRTAALCALLVLLAVGHARPGEPAGGPPDDPPEITLVGRLLLPEGAGSRGVEVIVTVAETGNDPRRVWLLFDEHGRFAETLKARPTRVTVTAGIGAEVHRVDAGDLPAAGPEGRIDLGEIDLRDRLTRHRMVVRAADGKPAGDVRVAMWSGPPPVGPQGEPVSLGSRQFPPVTLGTELEWLLAHDAHSIHFLVERPADDGRGIEWRSGRQTLFGPFRSTEIPSELVMD